MKAWRKNSAHQASSAANTLPTYNPSQQPSYYGAPQQPPSMTQYPSQYQQQQPPYSPPPGAPPPQSSFYGGNADGVKHPQEAYYPVGQAQGGAQGEHGYEYQQHLEDLRRDAAAGAGAGGAGGAVQPPGYEVATSTTDSSNGEFGRLVFLYLLLSTFPAFSFQSRRYHRLIESATH
jgi:hypothetical protein